MNNLNVTTIKPAPRDQVWDDAVDTMISLANERGLRDMVGAPAEAIERMQSKIHEKYHETEQFQNMTLIREICDLKMNASDFDYINANRHDRIAMIDQLIDSLRTMRRRM